MRNIVKLLMIGAAALVLNACTPSTGDPTVDAFLVQVQNIAKKVCGIEIIAAQIVAVVPVPVLTTPLAVATQLCNQVIASGKFSRRRLGAATTDVVRVRINGNVVDVTVRR